MGKGRQLIERRIEMYNSGDLDQLTAGLAEDAVWITPSTKTQGRAAIGELLRADHTAAPDRHIEPLGWVEEGDTVVMEYTWTGTHTGPLVRADGEVLPPTGEQITFPVVSIYRLRGDEVAAHRAYWDQLPSLQQLGVITLPERPV